MKKLLSIISAAVLSFSLAACGNTENSGNAETASASSKAAEAASSAVSTAEEGGEQTAGEELTKVRVAIMTGGASHWYAVIGKEAGIFEKNGLDIEITEFAAGVNTVDAVVMGQADFGNLADYACVNRLGNTQDNTNLEIVNRMSTSEGTSNGGLYVSDKVQSPEDLAGKGFASLAGTVWDYWTGVTYEAAGIEEADRNILNVDSPASAVAIMISGEADATWANGTNAAKLEEAGFKSILTLDDLGLYTDAYYISTSDYLEANPAVAEAFLKANKETADWIYANEDEAAEIFEKATGSPQKQFHQDLKGTRLVVDFPQQTLDHLNGIKDWAVANGRFTDFNILDFADFTALQAVYPDSITLEE